ncbi:methyltransferase domain-containing protein [Terrimicrobium sacchariphilum]|uniref:Methyltransferase domain-containing protein n=1 Tax=Terrimicrobium sacchariphilum TaxID=690879 RepID=A0A146G1Z9_TERSA|nr:class I SAM-dependent methyltransferase [Terrimicrobium sacchariphilum]GAT31889.1 methyltransferase domain-containing protein [Terrimicrobium sacchariphilum]
MNSDTHQAEIIRQFTLQAVPFARHQAHSALESFDFIRDIARLDGTQYVLDAGCGPGLVCCALAPHCREITGVDVTKAMIDEAGRRAEEAGLENTRFVEGDMAALPFADETFDVAVSRYVFHHLENPLVVLREMARVTRPGGRIVICDASPAAACRENYDRFEKLRDASHTSALTLEEFVALGEAVDLGEASIRRFGLPMELDSLIDSSFPSGERDELRAIIRGDIGRNACGFSAREVGERLCITFPITVAGWTRK